MQRATMSFVCLGQVSLDMHNKCENNFMDSGHVPVWPFPGGND